jgi:hypothetical protein
MKNTNQKDFSVVEAVLLVLVLLGATGWYVKLPFPATPCLNFSVARFGGLAAL